jgi:hypothetical protein
MQSEHPFSLTRGGPFYHLLRRAHLTDRRGNIAPLRLAAVVWVPLVFASLLQWALGGGLDPIVLDPTVHVRILIMVPLLVVAENLLEVRCASSATHARTEAIAERATLDAILDRTEHLRDSWVPEALLALLVALAGEAWLWGLLGWQGLFRSHPAMVSFATVWCVTIALPLVQFLTLRWLWRWLMWSYVLARLSRVSLSLNALHPDRAAGLRVLSQPIDAFSIFVASVASLLSASWMMKLHDHRATLQTLSPLFVAFAVIVLVIACGPLLVFSRQLYRVRYRDVEAYHDLARDYVDELRRKWITERSGESSLLGTPDIRTLNDLGGSYRTTEETRVIAFGVSNIARVWVGALVPMLPIAVVTMPMSEVASHLGHMLFGLTP